MIGWLCVLSIGILGISPGSRIPLEEAKRVLDAEAFERYPWGLVGFSSLVNSVKLVSYEGKKKYTLRGCVHALLIWVHLIVKAQSDIYPQWDDDKKVLTTLDTKIEAKVNAKVAQAEQHMASSMLMFHKRSMRNPSPYSLKIAFLDHWFVKTWVRDYKKYDPKTWQFSDTYKKVFNGNYPKEFSNNRKWLKDVDRFFLCHLINAVPSITDLLEECRPFTKMILLLLNEMVPERKKSSQQFRISRPKSVPKNEDHGDCGVYALKDIECKAVGCGFEGLSDQCIPAMRIKLAAKIYDEVSGL
ncbi:unnamed protein product [Brassica rapa]|uniref:Ubiquitin-like protease family profile domain-containing protein n=1 Tax=Brassica campestris TaxID=3711 RepID=A0A8D9CUZ2_BRACM|nr:unnamed protein product [Brassica rapa]